MNEHLKPVFDFLLPELEGAEVKYWVYGGLSIAAYKGEFIRRNKDVDIFVREEDFEKSRLISKSVCEQHDFEPEDCAPDKETQRPKFKVWIKGKDRFSIIPIYEEDNLVVFKYPKNKDEKYPRRILESVERKIDDYRFFTPPNDLIKEIFINHIKARPDKKDRESFQRDARAILSAEDFIQLGWQLN